jgi:hypothetical protein
MPVKSASGSRKTTSPKKGVEIIVKRGATRRFHTLKRETAEMPVTITWDRRTTERRTPQTSGAAGAERRGVERRQKPSFTWDLADFVVVAPTKRQKTSRKAQTRKS